jgi:predicted aspartyl protease
MITGTVTEEGEPIVVLPVQGQTWPAVIDTGFNGDLELPEGLRPLVNARYITQTEWLLGGGQSLVEDTYEVEFPFDGETVIAEVTFAPSTAILIGTSLMRHYRLTIDFADQMVLLERKVRGASTDPTQLTSE